MEQKIILLGSGSMFMMNAVANNLKTAGYDVVMIEPSLRAFSENQNDVDIIVMYLGYELLENMEMLVYVKDFCEEKNKFLYMIGEAPEIEECMAVIPEDIVTASFKKPLDIKKFVSRMDEMSNVPLMKKNKLILLVDDDGDYLKMVSRWLSGRYRVVIVNSGMQAITYLAKHKPDLILLDYAMPVTSGPQVLEMIRSETGTAAIPVFFLTGKDDKESVMKVVDLEPDGYILKSTGKGALLAKLEQFFREPEKR